MLTNNDILRLPYTEDLTEGGIAYALRSLTYAFDRANTSPYDRLRRLAGSAAVELAFRRHLSNHGIPFEVKALVSFSDRERYDVILKGRRCNIHSYLISRPRQIEEILRSPSMLLDAPALVPTDSHAADGHLRNDLYLFGFLAGLTAVSSSDLQTILRNDQPLYLAHVLPSEWRKPPHWNGLGLLVMKSDSDEEMPVEIHGQDQARNMKRVTVHLRPREKFTLTESFHSISCLHLHRPARARIGIHCTAMQKTHVISPLEWSNLWIYGREIFMAGFLPYEEFGHRAAALPLNSTVFQYQKTRVKNLCVPIASLKPIQILFQNTEDR